MIRLGASTPFESVQISYLKIAFSALLRAPVQRGIVGSSNFGSIGFSRMMRISWAENVISQSRSAFSIDSFYERNRLIAKQTGGMKQKSISQPRAKR